MHTGVEVHRQTYVAHLPGNMLSTCTAHSQQTIALHAPVQQDDLLRRAVTQHKGKSWKRISEYFEDRTDVQCLHRWQKVLNPELVKGPWTKEEDELVMHLVRKFGPKRWSVIAGHLKGRIGKQCRER